MHNTLNYKIKLLLIASWCLHLSLNGQTEPQPILWTTNWSPDGGYVVVGGDDGRLQIYDGETLEIDKIIDFPGETIHRTRWHPVKNVLALAGSGLVSRIIQFETGDTIILGNIDGGARAIAWNREGSKLAIGDYEGRIIIFDRSGNVLTTITKENTKTYTALDWHPTLEEVIVLSDDVRVYNLYGELVASYNHRNVEILLLATLWHKSGKFYVLGDYGNPDVPHPPVLQFRNLDHQILWESDVARAEYRNVSWNDKENRLACASDALRIFNRKGQLKHMGITPSNLWGVDYSPDGKYIITSSELGQITLWNKKAKKLRDLN